MTTHPGRGIPATAPPTREEARQWLLATLAATLPAEDLPASVDDATGLLGHGIGLDSIEILGLVCSIEEAFDVTVSDQDLDRAHFETVGALVTFIVNQLRS
jgi:acyl carrier protein